MHQAITDKNKSRKASLRCLHRGVGGRRDKDFSRSWKGREGSPSLLPELWSLLRVTGAVTSRDSVLSTEDANELQPGRNASARNRQTASSGSFVTFEAVSETSTFKRHEWQDGSSKPAVAELLGGGGECTGQLFAGLIYEWLVPVWWNGDVCMCVCVCVAQTVNQHHN